MTPEKVRSLKDLRKLLGIRSRDWDAIIVGDGSGTTWARSFGWGSVLIRADSVNRQMFHGGMSHGTNNMAEIMAVLHPLMALAADLSTTKSHGYQVHIVSDSQYVVNGIGHQGSTSAIYARKNKELWLAIYGVRRRGIVLHGHHVPRDTIDLNKLGHDLANEARKQIAKVPESVDWDPDTTNPDL